MAAPPARSLIAASLAWALLLPGCAWAPKSRVEEAHKLVQAIRAENAQMKDTTITLRAQNQELAQRAVDDARALRALEVANEEFERSIRGYQEDREKMRSAFREVERMARGDSRSGRAEAPGADSGGFHDLARALPGASFDDATGTLTVPAEALFPPGGSRPTAEGEGWIDGLAAEVASARPERVILHLAGSAADAPVRRAGLSGDDPGKGVAEKRARFLRDAVANRSPIEADRVEVSILTPP
ncbi:hypothetical protein TA3x_002176 [Tundrisphaera sp. TA3]|uniref:hypothetical protein n=1 Tax=Tundrisphaera sp. TA3 TaxID=3435775 RepID=UPI003EC15131